MEHRRTRLQQFRVGEGAVALSFRPAHGDRDGDNRPFTLVPARSRRRAARHRSTRRLAFTCVVLFREGPLAPVAGPVGWCVEGDGDGHQAEIQRPGRREVRRTERLVVHDRLQIPPSIGWQRHPCGPPPSWTPQSVPRSFPSPTGPLPVQRGVAGPRAPRRLETIAHEPPVNVVAAKPA